MPLPSQENLSITCTLQCRRRRGGRVPWPPGATAAAPPALPGGPAAWVLAAPGPSAAGGHQRSGSGLLWAGKPHLPGAAAARVAAGAAGQPGCICPYFGRAAHARGRGLLCATCHPSAAALCAAACQDTQQDSAHQPPEEPAGAASSAWRAGAPVGAAGVRVRHQPPAAPARGCVACGGHTAPDCAARPRQRREHPLAAAEAGARPLARLAPPAPAQASCAAARHPAGAGRCLPYSRRQGGRWRARGTSQRCRRAAPARGG